jgi:hypothetical protein
MALIIFEIEIADPLNTCCHGDAPQWIGSAALRVALLSTFSAPPVCGAAASPPATLLASPQIFTNSDSMALIIFEIEIADPLSICCHGDAPQWGSDRPPSGDL